MINKFKSVVFFALVIFGILGIASCGESVKKANTSEDFNNTNGEELSKDPSILIGISKYDTTYFYKNYKIWLERNYNNVKVLSLYKLPVDEALDVLEDCDGLLLAGGPDIYPEWYNQIDDTAKCEGFDRYRDTLEFALFNKAIEKKMPVFGICRGQQLINVALGGTLIPDIPSALPERSVKHRELKEFKDMHDISVEEDSYLANLTGQQLITVNSYHHQAIGELGKDLRIAATTSDNIPEAIEWNTENKGSFLLAVQWHPEQLEEGNPMSDHVAKAFTKEALLYQSTKNKE